MWTTAVLTPTDLAIALAAFALLTVRRLAPWLVVLATVLGSIAVQVI